MSNPLNESQPSDIVLADALVESDYMVTVKGFGHISTAKYRATSIDEAMRKARHAKGIHVEASKIEVAQ